MTTTYYISYQVRKSNGVYAWYCSKESTLSDTEKKYNEVCGRIKTRSANLWQKDHYEQSELSELFRDRYPKGSDSFSILKRYDRI